MTVTESSRATQKERQAKNRAILVELETVAVNGRKTLCDIIFKVLEKNGISCKLTDYSRYFLDRPLEEALRKIIADRKADVAAESLLHPIEDALRTWSAGPRKWHPALLSLLNKRRAMGLSCGIVCSIGDDLLTELKKTIQVEEDDDLVFMATHPRGRPPTSDFWLKLARTLHAAPSHCLALCGSMRSAKSAIAAGMRCLVVEDEFNAFQDFGGADYVADNLDKALLEKALTPA
jgi:beta-phosphoglucomutase-like phosphatase (HAD superfamily)